MDIPLPLPYTTETPFVDSKNRTLKVGPESKERENLRDPIGPAMHQHFNVIEIAVILIIGATTAIGNNLIIYYGLVIL